MRFFFFSAEINETTIFALRHKSTGTITSISSDKLQTMIAIDIFFIINTYSIIIIFKSNLIFICD
jgi:hypothetical protein